MPEWFARQFYQIVDDTFRLCGDFRGAQINGRTWTRSEVRSIANEKMLELIKLSGALKTVRSIPLLEGVNVYDLPPDCIMPLRFGMHGVDGYVLTHKSITDLDLIGCSRTTEGDPTTFYREFLAPNQVGVMPIPSRDGSTFLRSSDYGLLRQISDADGSIPFDANRPLRQIRGVPFVRTGDGQIIREVISPFGNLQVHYIRAPKIIGTDEFQYPDEAIPELVHKDIKYGVAFELLKGSKKKVHRLKQQVFGMKWVETIRRLQRIVEHAGPMNDVRPI